MADESKPDNQEDIELIEDTLATDVLADQDLNLPPDGSAEEILSPLVDNSAELESLDDGILQNTEDQPDMELSEGLIEVNDDLPDPFANLDDNDMDTPFASNSLDEAGPAPEPVKASTLNATLGNGVLDMDTIRNIKVNVQAVLGGISMSVSKLSNLKEGELVSLEKTIGEEIEILANGQLIAHGDIVVIEEDTPKFGITITSIVGS